MTTSAEQTGYVVLKPFKWEGKQMYPGDVWAPRDEESPPAKRLIALTGHQQLVRAAGEYAKVVRWATAKKYDRNVIQPAQGRLTAATQLVGKLRAEIVDAESRLQGLRVQLQDAEGHKSNAEQELERLASKRPAE